jgi:hypothetical protein
MIMIVWSRGDSKDEHLHLSDVDAVLESVMVFRLAAAAVAEVVVPLDWGHTVTASRPYDEPDQHVQFTWSFTMSTVLCTVIQ